MYLDLPVHNPHVEAPTEGGDTLERERADPVRQGACDIGHEILGAGELSTALRREFQETEIIIAPSIKTEGKLFQTVQSVGMGTR